MGSRTPVIVHVAPGRDDRPDRSSLGVRPVRPLAQEECNCEDQPV